MINFIIILLFSLIGMRALFHPGLFTAHDIWHQIVRLHYYYQAVIDGQFPPIWIGQLAKGFGYPLFAFSYNLPWLIGIILLKIGLSIPTAIKALFFISYLASGLTMYYFVNYLLKDRAAALLSSILYLWLPYHFLIIFVGASMGIAFIFTFLPLLFLGIHLTCRESKFGIPVLALALAGLILSHIMHLVFLFPAILIFFVWEIINTQKRIIFLKNIAFGLTIGALISSFYLMPAMYYNQFTRARQETGFSDLFKRHFINFNQLLYSKWGYGPIINNAKNGENSFQLGFAQWVSIIATAFLLLQKKLTRYRGLGITLLTGFAVSILLMLDISRPVWQTLAKFTTIDFPFRLLLPVSFLASICAGLILINLKYKFRFIIFIFLTILAIYSNRNHINVNLYTNLATDDILNMETEITTNTYNEYLPTQANPSLLNKPWNEITAENAAASGLKRTTNTISFDLSATKETSISAGQFYFPGQILYINNQPKKIDIDKEGRISFTVDKGDYKITIKYQETSLIKTSKILTLFGIIVIILLLLNGIRKKLIPN